MEPNNLNKKSNGALVGSIIVVLILIIGGVYLWMSNSLNDRNSRITPSNNDLSTEVNLEESRNIETELNNIEQENNSIDTDLSVEIEEVQ